MRLASLLPFFLFACVGDSTPVDGGTDSGTDTSVPDVGSDITVADVTPDAKEAGAFNGNDYGNLELWVSADVGVTAGDAGDVSGWTDRSNLHRTITVPSSDCSQGPTLVPSAIHGLPTLQFNGGTQCLSVSGAFSNFTLGFTGYVVMQPGNCNSQFLGNAGGVFDSSDNTNFNYADPISIHRNYASSAQVASGDGMITGGTGGASITGSSSWVPAVAHILEFRLPAASGGALVTATAYVDGTFQNNLNPNDPLIPNVNGNRTTTFIGNQASKTSSGYSLYCGMIGEMLIYSKALSDADRQAVETYLKTRWSL